MLNRLLHNKTLKYNFKAEQSPNHVVDPSPWPLLTALSIFQLVLSLVYYMETGKYFILFISIIQLIFYLGNWFINIVIEATFEGNHTLIIQQNIKFAMILFTISEVMFFFGFFWSFFYFSLSPSIWIGCAWPPLGITPIDCFGLPLANTILLLSSGISLTYAHKMILTGKLHSFNFAMLITIIYGFIFLVIQYFEYNYAQFSISDSVYGSIFYLLTGFHGLHVLIGLIFLIICLYRGANYHFTIEHHVGFECAAWYWHFVDVVWLFLYIFVYCLCN